MKLYKLYLCKELSHDLPCQFLRSVRTIPPELDRTLNELMSFELAVPFSWLGITDGIQTQPNRSDFKSVLPEGGHWPNILSS